MTETYVGEHQKCLILRCPTKAESHPLQRIAVSSHVGSRQLFHAARSEAGHRPYAPISPHVPHSFYFLYIVETERLWCVCVQGAPGELRVAEVTAFLGHLRK